MTGAYPPAWALLAVLLAQVVLALSGYGGNTTSEGDYYSFAVPAFTNSFDSYSPRVLITTSSLDPIDVTVSVVGIGFETTSTVTRYQYASIALPTSVRLTGTGKQKKTVKVTSSGIISVHCVDNECAEGDGFLALPTSQLGNQYYVVSYKPYSSSYPSFLCVSALDSETSVDITTKAGLKHQVILEPYESYRFDGGSLEDLTGTLVQSTRPVSVISGVRSRVPETINNGGDGLLEQLPPIRSWGFRFVLAPFVGRTSGYVYRVLSANQTSTLHVSNRGTIQIGAGEWFEDAVTGNSVISIESDQPVLVMEYMKGRGAEGRYDCSMIVVPPLNSYINNVTFPVFRCTFSNNIEYNIHVIIDCQYASDLIYDDVTPVSDWEQLKTEDNKMCVSQRAGVTTGVHGFSHHDPSAKFTVAVYVLFASSFAYAYPAGYSPVANQPTTEPPPFEQSTISDVPVSNQPTTEQPPFKHPPISDVPGLNLYCEGTNVTAVFNSSVIPFTRASDVHLWDPDCTASEYGDSQAIISTQYPGCQTFMEETKEHILFRNALILNTSNPASPIKPPQVEIQCQVERRHIVETSFTSSLKRKISFGNFSFGLQIFHDKTFLTPYEPEDYPIETKFGANLYFAASVDAVKDLELLVDSCWGTPSANPWHETTYSIIYNGCPDDKSVVFFESGDPNIQQFTFKAFAFKGDSWLVFIHCQLLVCDVGAPNSRCAQGCIEATDISPRKRRSSADLHVISSGPLVVRG